MIGYFSANLGLHRYHDTVQCSDPRTDCYKMEGFFSNLPAWMTARHALHPRFVNQGGRWYHEPSFRIPRVAVSADVLVSSASSTLLAADFGPQREPSRTDRGSSTSLDGSL